MSSQVNTEIWGRVCSTDAKFTKNVEFGKRKFTTIDPTHQAYTATKIFGPMGTGWGLKNIQWSVVNSLGRDGKPEPTMVLTGTLFYPGGEIETGADMPFKSGDDTFKKLRTSAISKALAGLGFNADVFLGKFDDMQYRQETEERVKRGDAAVERLRAMIDQTPTLDKIDMLVARAKSLIDSKQINGSSYDELLELIEGRRSELLEAS